MRQSTPNARKISGRWAARAQIAERLVLLAVDDHKYRIEVGYGLEGILPDGKVGEHRAGDGSAAAGQRL